MKMTAKIDLGGVAGLLAVTAVAYLGGVSPIISAHTEAIVLRSQISTERATLHNEKADESELLRRVTGLEQELESFTSNPNLTLSRNARISQLTQLALGAGIELESVQPGEPRAAGDLNVIEIRIAGAGQYADLIGMLPMIRSTFPDFGVQRLVISRGSENTGRMSLDIVWYIAVDDKTDPDGAQ
ncbi:MAG: hypothetical protein AAGB48_10120 [Planctomycetota bacterium]